MSLGYAWEQLYTAVSYLATSPENIQERVVMALLRIDIANDTHPDTFPEDMFLQIKEMGRDIGAVKNMTDEEAIEIAEKIFMMFCEISRKFYTRSSED